MSCSILYIHLDLTNILSPRPRLAITAPVADPEEPAAPFVFPVRPPKRAPQVAVAESVVSDHDVPMEDGVLAMETIPVGDGSFHTAQEEVSARRAPEDAGATQAEEDDIDPSDQEMETNIFDRMIASRQQAERPVIEPTVQVDSDTESDDGGDMIVSNFTKSLARSKADLARDKAELAAERAQDRLGANGTPSAEQEPEPAERTIVVKKKARRSLVHQPLQHQPISQPEPVIPPPSASAGPQTPAVQPRPKVSRPVGLTAKNSARANMLLRQTLEKTPIGQNVIKLSDEYQVDFKIVLNLLKTIQPNQGLSYATMHRLMKEGKANQWKDYL